MYIYIDMYIYILHISIHHPKHADPPPDDVGPCGQYK